MLLTPFPETVSLLTFRATSSATSKLETVKSSSGFGTSSPVVIEVPSPSTPHCLFGVAPILKTISPPSVNVFEEIKLEL